MILEIDESSIDSISSAIAKLHKLRTQLQKNSTTERVSNSRWEKRLKSFEKEFELAEKILQSNISSVFEGAADSVENSYYVYVHCNPLEPVNVKKNFQHAICAVHLKVESVPFYVGKGTGDRCFDLNRNEGHRKVRKQIESAGKSVIVHKVAENLTEAEAFALESKLIDVLGLKSLSSFNLLTNLDEGKNAELRRSLYPRGCAWLLNRNKMKLYNSVPKG